MKKSVLIFLLTLFTLIVKSQTGESANLALGIERMYENENIMYLFKPGKPLKINTIKGEIIFAQNYTLLENSIVVNQNDTIDLKDITKIRGKVFGNEARKITGVVLSVFSLPAGCVVVFLAAFTGNAPILVAVPFAGAFVGGLSLIGARTFNTKRQWTLFIQK